METEIAAGLRNAIERGANLEQAVKSFISAGYEPQLVYRAAKILSEGNSAKLIYTEEKSIEKTKKKDANSLTVVLIIFLLLVIVGAAAFIYYKKLF